MQLGESVKERLRDEVTQSVVPLVFADDDSPETVWRAISNEVGDHVRHIVWKILGGYDWINQL